MGSSPWWPAKTLDPQRDPSYPPDADPPRPTSIPIRCALPFLVCAVLHGRWCHMAAVAVGVMLIGLLPTAVAAIVCCPGCCPPCCLLLPAAQPLTTCGSVAHSHSTQPLDCRLFGTLDFQWIGSKRALTDWEEVSWVALVLLAGWLAGWQQRRSAGSDSNSCLSAAAVLPHQ